MPNDDIYPTRTWYGTNPEHTLYGPQPPDPTCEECDADLPEWDPDDRATWVCDGCREGLAEWRAEDAARKEWNRRHGFREDGSYR